MALRSCDSPAFSPAAKYPQAEYRAKLGFCPIIHNYIAHATILPATLPNVAGITFKLN
jgi:hypothetical protein